MDAILDQPLDEILAELPVRREIKEACWRERVRTETCSIWRPP